MVRVVGFGETSEATFFRNTFKIFCFHMLLPASKNRAIRVLVPLLFIRKWHLLLRRRSERLGDKFSLTVQTLLPSSFLIALFSFFLSSGNKS